MNKQGFMTFMIILLTGVSKMFGQAYVQEWQWLSPYNVSYYSGAYSIGTTSDDGFILAGYKKAASFNTTDFRVFKLTENGTVQWDYTYGGTGNESAKSVQQCSDGGYIIVGSTTSTNTSIGTNHGGKDILVVKTDFAGSIQWLKTYGGTANDAGDYVQQTSDKGYIIAGSTASADGNVTSNHGLTDAWLLKLDSTGVILWQKSYGGSGLDSASYIRQVIGGGYIVAGTTKSNDGDVTWNQGGSDAWIIRVDSAGNIIWQKTYGTTGNEYCISIQQTSDSGFVAGGFFSPNTILKLDTAGLIQWGVNTGNTEVKQSKDGGYIVGLNTNHFQSGQSGGGQVFDATFFKLDHLGNTEWSIAYAPLFGAYRINSLCESSDGGFAIGGEEGFDNFWAVKFNALNGIEDYQLNNSIVVYPNPTKDAFTIRSEKALPLTPYEVIDALGRTVLSGTMQGEQCGVNASGLQSGVYTLCIGASRLKLLKQD